MTRRYHLPSRTRLVAGLLTFFFASTAFAADEVLVVANRTFNDSLSAYAQVRPIQLVNVQTLIDGQVEDLKVLPGQHVRVHELLARLRGVAQASQSAAAKAAVAQADGALVFAQRNYSATRKTYPDISTRQQLEAALSALIDAQARLTAAQARLALVHGAASVTAPVAGTVLRLAATSGQVLAAGATLLVMQPDHGLWLKASFYGDDAHRVSSGMTGKFLPADGGSALPVRVRSVINEVGSDGGLGVGCVPLGRADWTAGEAGTLVLGGSAKSWPAVPSQALILDAGHWWVVVREGGHYRNQLVTIGSQADGWTAITHGVKPGDHVVAEQAYEIYHRDFARNYQMPD